MKTIKTILATASLALGIPIAANAHTIEYGFAPAGAGGVTIWFGSYHSFSQANADGIPNEGFLQIQGINGNPFPLTAVDFSLAIPAPGNAPPAPGYVQGYHSATSLQTTLWQGVTFTSAVPGDYSFFFNQSASSTGAATGVSAVFAAWDSSITQGTFSLTPAVINPTPDGGSTLALLGLAGLGIARLKRRLG